MTGKRQLQARVFALEEWRTTKLNQVIDRLENLIKVVNTQSTENYHLDQSVQDIQQRQNWKTHYYLTQRLRAFGII